MERHGSKRFITCRPEPSNLENNSDGAIIRTVHYQIRQGDNLSSIAQKFSVAVTDIMKWNNIERGSYIKPGQKLKLYVDVTKVNV